MTTEFLNLSDRYNASTTFIDANLEAGRGNKHAVLCGDQAFTYNEIAAMVNQTANALLKIGVQMEQRILILLPDCPEFAAAFFGSIRIGAVPIPVNTLLAAADYEYLLNDSRAVALIVSEQLYPTIEPIRKNLKWLKQMIVTGNAPQDAIHFEEWIKDESKELAPAKTSKDDPSCRNCRRLRKLVEITIYKQNQFPQAPAVSLEISAEISTFALAFGLTACLRRLLSYPFLSVLAGASRQ
jgi:benzoate-CoA ligase